MTRVFIRNSDTLYEVLSGELDKGSGLNDKGELGIISSIVDKIGRYGSEPDLTSIEREWLKKYLNSWVQDW